MNGRKWLSFSLILVWCAVLVLPGAYWWDPGLFLPATAFAQEPNQYGLGLISTTTVHPSLPPGFKTGTKLPSAVDNSVAGLPPVGDQGSQNSSVAWATTYYNKSFQEWQEHSWDVSLAQHQFSPAMTYNMRTDYTPVPCATDQGMRFADALAILVKNGALPLSEFGYNPSDPCTQPDAGQLAAASGYRSLGYGAFFVYDESGHVTAEQFEALKAHLANGNLVMLGIPVYPGFYRPELTADIIDTPQAGEVSAGYHAVTLVGYDDATCGQGAFKFVNSWGPAYGGDGYARLTYDFVLEYAIEAWWMVDNGSAPHGCIEGDVLDNAGLPVPGVAIAVDGPTPWTGMTDASGHFQSGSVLASGSYTVTPTKAGYSFDPPSAQVQVAGGLCATQDFTAYLLSEATITIEPASQMMTCGEVSTFRINIRDVADFYGVQFRLTFNPAVIEVIDPDGDPANGIIVPGPIFPTNEFFVGQEIIDNGTGQIDYAITLLRIPKAPPFAGSGTLAEITVRALAAGVSPLVFGPAITADIGGKTVQVRSEDGIITVECLTTLSGHAYLEGIASAPASDHSGITVTLESAGLTPVEFTGVTGVDGSYLFGNVPAGTYTVTLAHDTFLSVVVADVVVLEGQHNVLCGLTLLAGDLNNDDKIDILDLTLCASNFGTTMPAGDVNADGIVNIYDLVLIGKNFKLASPQQGICD